MKNEKGITFGENPANGFSTVELHYSADSKKRSPEWKVRKRAGMSQTQWDREMEMIRVNSSGRPVYGKEFQIKVHVLKEYAPLPDLPIIRGWDFGFNQTCMLAQYDHPRLIVFDEIMAEKYFENEPNVGTIRFAPFVSSYCQQKYVGFTYIDVVDPAGFAKEQGSEMKICQPMINLGMKVERGEKLFSVRRDAVLKFLGMRPAGQVCFQIVQTACTVSTDGFIAGYRFPEDKSEPKKNIFSHPHDCIQYICCWVLENMKKRRMPIVVGGGRPSYSFTRGR